MPPTRTTKSGQRAVAGPSHDPNLSISTHGRREDGGNGKVFHKKRVRQDDGGTGSGSSDVPGVQKLKSALRQTRRLLAKDHLAADVRVETERRLRALEGDLEEAERRNKERTFAKRYHKIKFFDRQKVMRKIKQLKRDLNSSEKSKSDSASAKDLQSALFAARVDLNYILHFPKLDKYVCLFPSSANVEDAQLTEGHIEGSSDTKTNAKREEVREWVRSRMQEGELSAEPEIEEMKKEKDGGGGKSKDGTKDMIVKGGKRMTDVQLPQKSRTKTQSPLASSNDIDGGDGASQPDEEFRGFGDVGGEKEGISPDDIDESESE